MAELNGQNYAKAYISVPKQLIEPGQVGGKLKLMYDEITLSAELAVNDTIIMGKLPKGAMIVDASVKAPSMGATGTFELGNAAGALSIESAASASIIASINAGGQAVLSKPTLASTAVLKKFAESVNIELKCTQITASGAGKKIQVAIFYVMD